MTLLTILVLAATGGCVWFYWQVQQAEARIKMQEAQIREQSLLVGELADQLSMASQYLYEAMDQSLLELEKRIQVQTTNVSIFDDRSDRPAVVGAPFSATDAERTASPADELYSQLPLGTETASYSSELEETECAYHPHFQALSMTTQGVDPVEIARRTGLGVEELHLLMRFQDELSPGG
jgi:hypothetical protein